MAKADFPRIWVFWLGSLVSNKAESPTDAFPKDGALIKPLACSRLSGTCVIFCLSPRVGRTWGLVPLSAASLHKICGDIFTVKPFPCLFRRSEVSLKQFLNQFEAAGGTDRGTNGRRQPCGVWSLRPC